MSEVRISILGFGTVGRALAERIAETGAPIRIVSVTDSQGTIEDRRGLDPRALLDAKAKGAIAGDGRGAHHAVRGVDADVVVDLLPTDLVTGEPSYSLILESLRAGKGVVTASKGALALHTKALRLTVAASRGSFRHSGSVCGGTPILELLRGAFQGDRVERFDAVLNGSTNFVLAKLEEGIPWEAALAEARAQGILEADPSLDLLGLDAAAKAVILANEAWSASWSLGEADVRGIVGITARDAQEAKANGLAIRLVARASPEKGVSVAPVTLPRDHPLVTDGTENAVRLKLAGAGTIALRGPGAGGRETASAVLSDILALGQQPRAIAPLVPA